MSVMPKQAREGHVPVAHNEPQQVVGCDTISCSFYNASGRKRAASATFPIEIVTNLLSEGFSASLAAVK